MMNKYGYDFRIQSAEIYNEDIQCLKQWSHLCLLFIYLQFI
jgi:hypothetical protein